MQRDSRAKDPQLKACRWSQPQGHGKQALKGYCSFLWKRANLGCWVLHHPGPHIVLGQNHRSHTMPKIQYLKIEVFVRIVMRFQPVKKYSGYFLVRAEISLGEKNIRLCVFKPKIYYSARDKQFGTKTPFLSEHQPNLFQLLLGLQSDNAFWNHAEFSRVLTHEVPGELQWWVVSSMKIRD